MIEMLNSMGVTNAMITSTVITLIICLLAILAGRHMEMIPSGLQNAMEVAVEKLGDFFADLMGEYAGRKYLPFVGTLFIYVLLCNYSGLLPLSGELPGVQAPTSSINFPLGLALLVFFFVQFVGIKETHGLGFYKHYFKPIAALFPLMIVEDLVKPVSLTLRLYGNIYGEESVTHVFFGMVPLGLPIIMQIFSVLMGMIQALVFSLLAGIYIAEAAEHGAEEHEHLLQAQHG
ncbi:F0F1 ATP synthase subunit A [Aminipila butyrica]|uniref:ATP synthase subunit a n=1 Tax=Aminipila butyrica TaxID=433296 RepID=A0A858BZL5_9FIRM|nr:F0F1 ATP synthase subunit A [Aminipila butyrica]QIB70598.1 F0F1 ATP synthase subunit A [Aminipila butyrica]